MNRYDSPLTPEQIAAVKDEEIDFSDIPELDEDFWREAELKLPDRTEQVTLRVKGSVLAYFKASGKGYQTRINQVLESYVRRKEHLEQNPMIEEMKRLQQNLEQNPMIEEMKRLQQNLEQNPMIEAMKRLQQNLEQSPAIEAMKQLQQNLEQSPAIKAMEQLQQNLPGTSPTPR